jgi:protocatechuate 3,4-dioxygenase, beta subunit
MREPTYSNRRTILAGLAAAPLVAPSTASAATLARTPSATEGPFYPSPSMRFQDINNDLVRISGTARDAIGEIIILKGRVLRPSRAVVSGATIEIWQCDGNGRYLHRGDDQRVPRDLSFQGFGRTITDANGAYSFRTIKPVSYPGRTPHIHVKVISGNRELTTQFYLANNPRNERDGLYRRMNRAERLAVEMVFRNGPVGLETTVDIVI